MNIEKVLEKIDSFSNGIGLVFSLHRFDENEEFGSVDRNDFLCAFPEMKEALNEFPSGNYNVKKHAINGDFDGKTFTYLKAVEKDANFVSWLV